MSEIAPPDLGELAQSFGEEVSALLNGVLPDVPPIDVVKHGSHYVVRPGGRKGRRDAVPLFTNGRLSGWLEISIRCRLDSHDRYIAVEDSSFGLKAELDRTPVLRFKYKREMRSAPHAHIHVHAHRGALSHLLSLAGHQTPHDMSSLHIPVGGSRLRPCLEDLLQFLIVECRFDSVDGWQQHIETGRERWRRKQVAAMVRDVPREAARVLADLGYGVTPPSSGHPQESRKTLCAW